MATCTKLATVQNLLQVDIWEKAHILAISGLYMTHSNLSISGAQN